MAMTRPDYCCGRCPETGSGGVDCTCFGNPRCRGPICDCGHGAIDHHGADHGPARGQGCTEVITHIKKDQPHG